MEIETTSLGLIRMTEAQAPQPSLPRMARMGSVSELFVAFPNDVTDSCFF